MRHRITSYLSNSRRLASSEVTARKQLIILGTGWGSYSVFQNVNRRVYDVIVVSPRNHFLFTPLLCSTTVGTLEFRSIIQPIRNTAFRKADHFCLARATTVDFAKRLLTCKSVINPNLEYALNYDRLVIGVGALPSTFGVPGVEEHAFFLKEIADARRIRNKIIDNMELSLQPGISIEERRRLLSIVIVGGGPTGVEFGAELHDFIKEDACRLYDNAVDDIRVTLIESVRVLPSFDTKLQEYAEKKMRARKGFSIVKSSVVEVRADSVILKDGSKIPCGLVVWSTGLSPRPFVSALPITKTARGQIIVDNHLGVNADNIPEDTVFALGDCCQIAGQPLPATAQVAERQGRYLASQLNSPLGVKVPPFSFQSSGMLAYLGDYRALADVHTVPHDFQLAGITSWFLWRSAYFTRLGSWRLRFQVPFDWMKTFFFGRDVSRF